MCNVFVGICLLQFPIYYHICVATAQGPYTVANFRNRVSSCILIKRFSGHFEEKFSVYLKLSRSYEQITVYKREFVKKQCSEKIAFKV